MITNEEFSELLEKYNYSYKIGKIIEGYIAGYEGDNLLVDIKAKNIAICPENEILIPKDKNIKDAFEIGKSYEFTINSSEDEDGIFYLSHRKVALARNLAVLEEKFKNNEVVLGTITNTVKGGISVNVMGIKGFVPSSQLKNQEEKIGDEIELKILALDMAQNNFILSNKKVYSDSQENVRKEIFDKIELNMVVKGEVVRLTDFGAFIDIGGIDALLPLSQISWKWIDDPSDILKINDKIEVEIIGIDKEKQRVSLSLKSLEENPWIKAGEVIEDKKTIEGVVTRIKPFGAFVEVYPKVEGLLNKSQMQQYVNKFSKELSIGDKINVYVKKFDVDNQKINLEIEQEEG